MKKYDFLIYPLFILIIGMSIGILIKDDIILYEVLSKPKFSSPKIVFPIAWGILYILIGITKAFLNQKEIGLDKKINFIYYFGLLLNFLWPIIFFQFGNYVLALIDLILLIIVVFISIIMFYKKNKISGYLFIIYFLWLIYAFYLNLGIVILN